ncbi:MAG: hypothetical protein KAH38_08360, partial [Candidatus Hydrogenedentes bacterium]|nr:hypothetical protein [Candidatus Hydrogenedentota bacterium]
MGSPVDQNVNMSMCAGEATAATIDGYSVTPRYLGKDKTGTLTISGTNLMLLLGSGEELKLVPELGNLGSAYIDLLTSPLAQAPRYSGSWGTTMSIDFQFSKFLNPPAGGGADICTDGEVLEFSLSSSGALVCDTPGKCNILIDTIEPYLRLSNYPNPSDANTGSPKITANRVAPPVAMPGSWIPGNPAVVTPKNNADFTTEDMHVYLNAGSRSDVPFSTIPPSPPLVPTSLNVQVQAYFTDPVPNDGMNFYDVEIAGFITAPLTVPGLSPFDLPA